MGWTNKEEEHLIELLKQDLTSTQIASFFPDKTRNAIIGKVARMNLELPNSGSKASVRRKRGFRTRKQSNQDRQTLSRIASPKRKIVEKKPEPYRPLNGVGVPFFDRAPKQCAWPLWGLDALPEDKHVCGQPIAENGGQPYCEHHHKINRSQRTDQYGSPYPWMRNSRTAAA